MSPKKAVEDLEKKAGDPRPYTLQDSRLTSLALDGEGRLPVFSGCSHVRVRKHVEPNASLCQ